MNLETKLLEIRDRGTHVPALAIRLKGNNPLESYYIHHRCGYPQDGSAIVLMKLYNQDASVDPYAWDDRTMTQAHKYIYDNFDKLQDGYVVDVSYILGETTEPKVSERITTPNSQVDGYLYAASLIKGEQE